MNLPRVSVVTCSYQQSRFLESSMQSVLQQDYPDLEYIVMDGGSQDGSLDIIRRHESRLAYWESRKDRGQSDAISRGFARSSGEIQGWLCSDDLLLPRAIQSVGRYFAENSDACFVYGDAIWIDSDGRCIRPKREPNWNWLVSLFDHNYLPQPSCFWRRSLYEQVGGIDLERHLTMDADLWFRFARVCQPIHLGVFLSCMRSHSEQKTRSRLSERDAEYASLIRREAGSRAERYASVMQPAARVLRIVSKALAGGYTAALPQGTHEWLATLSTHREAGGGS